MPGLGMQRGMGFMDGAFGSQRAVSPRVVPSSRGRDDGRAMAPDADQLARQLARRDDAELLALTQSVPAAFDVFFVRHSKAIASYLWRHTGNQDVAADLTSETFAVALEAVARYDPAKGAARGWLFGIAKITMLASYRQQRAERSARERLGHAVTGYSDDGWDEVEARIDASLWKSVV